MLRPTLVLGLGDAGARTASQLAASVVERDPARGAVLGTLCIDPSSFPRAVPLNGSPEPAAGEDQTGPGPTTPASYRDALLGRESELKQSLLHTITRICDQRRTTVLERGGHPVAAQLIVLAVAALADPIGSTALPVVLATIRKLLDSTLLELAAEIHLTLLMPDLLAEEPAPEDYARAYAALQELEAELDGTEDVSGIPVDGVWLFARRSVGERFLRDEGDLFSVLEEHTLSLLRATPPAAVTMGPATRQRVRGYTTRYCTFGCSRLRFPRDELISAAMDTVLHQQLQRLPEMEKRCLPADFVNPEAERFTEAQQLRALPDRVAEGLSLLRAFPPPGDDARGQHLVASLRESAKRYEAALGQMQQQMARRSAELAAGTRTAFEREIQRIVADPGYGTLSAAHFWLTAQMGSPPKYQSTPASVRPRGTVRAVLNHLEDELYKLLFGSERDEGLASYVRLHPEASGGPRQALEYLTRNVESRVFRKHRLKDDIERLEEELENAATAPSDRAGGERRLTANEAAYNELLQSQRESRLQALRAHLETTEAALAEAMAMQSAAKSEVDRLDEAIHDEVVRWDRFHAQEAALREAIDGAQQTYEAAESNLAEEEIKLDDARLRLRTWLVAVGSLVAVAGAGVIVALDNSRIIAALLLLLLASGAAVVWDRAGRAYLEARERINQAQERCRRAREVLLGRWDEFARRRCDHLRFSQVADWCEWLPEFLAQLARGLEEMRQEIEEQAAAAGERARTWEPPSSASIENLVPAGGLAGLVSTRADEIDTRVHNFWRTRPLPDLVGAYLGEREALVGNKPEAAFAAETVAAMVRDLGAAIQESFTDLRVMSVEDFFRYQARTPDERQQVVDRLYRAAAPFSKSVYRMPGQPNAESEYAAVVHTSGSPVRNVLRELGYESVHCYPSTQVTEVTISRVGSGLPAFQLATVHEAKRHLDAMDESARAALYANPEGRKTLPELVPQFAAP